MNETGPVILEAELLDEGAVITFTDGKSAFYSAALLYAVFNRAKDLEFIPEDEVLE